MSVLDLAQQRGLLSAGATPLDLVDAAIARAQNVAGLNAIITDNFATARAQATNRAVDGALSGIPMVHKDLFCTAGLRTTCASKMLANFVPPYSATVVNRLEEAGAICIAKASMDEFAMGSSNEHSAFGRVANPWDSTRVPGGSSGGSAALVAANVVAYATASDTGGSVRQPAAFCGVTGFKPSYGRISRFGMIAYASSLDQAGVIAHSASDCADVYQRIVGFDPNDGTTLNIESGALNLSTPLKGKKIGVPSFAFGTGVSAGVADAVKAALAHLQSLGAEIVPIELRYAEQALAAYYVIAPAEASSNLSRFDGVRYGHRSKDAKSLQALYVQSRSEGFGSEVQKRILLGTYVLSAGYFDAYYLQAQKVRRLIAESYASAFADVDLIATPTAPTTAFIAGSNANDPNAEILADVFTVGVNLAGLPAISVPCGLSEGLPVGLQLIGPRLSEASVLSAAHQYQLASDFHRLAPKGFEVSR